jgi:uncharacterized protein (DUF697 family)
MTRKQLPRAITPGSSDLLQTVVGAVADEEAPVVRRALSRDAIEPEPLLAISSAAPANDAFVAKPSNFQKLSARRRVLARRIVDRNSTLAAIGGLTPLPIANIAGIAAVIMGMVKKLCGLYQIPFERDRTRSLIIGVLGGAAPTGLGAATTSTIGLLVAPAPAFLGLAVSALTAGALTRAIGEVFIESFERDAMLAGVAEIKPARTSSPAVVG